MRALSCWRMTRFREVLPLHLANAVLLAALLALGSSPVGAAPPASGETVRVYVTTADLSSALQRQPDLTFGSASGPVTATIQVDPRTTYQQIDGFGGGLTDSSAWLLFTRLSPAARERVMRDLFSPTEGIGLSFLRLPIGASDFTHDGVFYSYDDMRSGGSDPTLSAFSIRHDTAYIIPLLREALALNPRLHIEATPWSPPGWMKENGVLNNLSHAGRLRPSSYAPYARYFVKFIQAYRAEDIPIFAITPQNEPGAAGSYPATELPASDEIRLVRDYLGPALAQAGLHTKIFSNDMEWSSNGTNLRYPLTVMSDPGANRYLAGTAYHCYRGNPEGMTMMHERFPGKDIYETECSSGNCTTCPWTSPAPPVELAIAATRNWSKTVALWNLALDPQGGPPAKNGCTTCIAPVTVDPASGAVTYTADYYQLGQLSRFVWPGAYRIASTTFVTAYHSGAGYGVTTLDDAAFRNPDGSLVLVAYNAGGTPRTFWVQWGKQSFSYTLPAAAAATFIWSGAASRG